MSANVERLLTQIKSLSLEEQRQVRAALDSTTALKPPMTEDGFERMMVESGLLAEIPAPFTDADVESFRSYKPIEVKGKPVSETIIEERR